MPAAKQLDPTASLLAYFGAEIRRLREDSGWSQAELADALDYAKSHIGMIENAQRTPTEHFAQRCDHLFGGDGTLTRLWSLINRHSHPPQPVTELEADAVEIRIAASHTIPPLLQTPGYTTALAAAAGDEHPEHRATETKTRQHIVHGPHRPRLWVVLDEAALTRPIGDPDIMRDQLTALSQATTDPRTIIQILPTHTIHACLYGTYTLYHLHDDTTTATIHDATGERPIANPHHIARLHHAFTLAQTDAQPRTATPGLLDRHTAR